MSSSRMMRGLFVAKEAYRSATQNSASGSFYGVTNNGLMCITSPCFSYDEVLLNSANRITKLSDVNLEMSGASPDDISWAYQLMADGGSLYAAGSVIEGNSVAQKPFFMSLIARKCVNQDLRKI